MKTTNQPQTWTPTNVQFLYKHLNGGYYVRTFIGGKDKRTSLKTKLLTVARNRMKEHLEAAERVREVGNVISTPGVFRVSKAIEIYRRELESAPIRPKTKAYRAAGLKLLLRSWDSIEEVPVGRISSRQVEEWIGRLHSQAKPYVPTGAKKATHNSTGASVTTLKCALDALRQVLDVAVTNGNLGANPARNATVLTFTRKLFKLARRAKAQSGGLVLPSRAEFMQIVEAIRNAGVSDCVAASEFVQFIAFCGARRNEAINVTWGDVDFKRGQIHLRVTKNGEARWVPMMKEMHTLLEKMKAQRVDAGSDVPVLRVKEAQGFITSACLKVGVQRFTTHALRHLFGTTCLEAGVDVRTTAAWLGHKDNGALLLKIYSHIRGQHETEMIKKVRFAES